MPKPVLFLRFYVLTLYFLWLAPAVADDAPSDNFTGTLNFRESSHQVEPADESERSLILQQLPYPENGSIAALATSDLGLVSLSPLSDWGFRLWDPGSGRILKRYGYHIGPMMYSRRVQCELKATQFWAAASCNQGTPLSVVDLRNGHELELPDLRDSELTPLAADQGSLVTRGFENTIEIHDLKQGSRVQRIEAYAGTIRALAVGEGYIAGGMDDSSLSLWKLSDGQLAHRLTGHDYDVTAVAISDRRVVSAGGNRDVDKSLKVWELETGRLIKTLEMPSYYAAHQMRIQNGLLMSLGTGEAGELNVWDWKTLAHIVTHEVGPIEDFALHQNKLYLLQNEAVSIIDVRSGDQLGKLEGQAFAIAAEGDTLLTAGTGGKIYRWNGKTHTPLTFYDTGHRAITGLWLQGRQVLYQTDHYDLEVLDLQTGKSVYRMPRGSQAFYAGGLQGDRLVTMGQAQKIDIWNLAQGKLAYSLADLPDFVSAASLQAQRLALGFASGQVGEWNLQSVSQVRQYPSQREPITAISLQGPWLAVGDADGKLNIWGQGQDQPIHSFRLGASIHSLDLTAERLSAVLEGQDDKQAPTYQTRFWHPGSGQELGSAVLQTPALASTSEHFWKSAGDIPVSQDFGAEAEPLPKLQTFNTHWHLQAPYLLSLSHFIDADDQLRHRIRWLNLETRQQGETQVMPGQTDNLVLKDSILVTRTNEAIHRWNLAAGTFLGSDSVQDMAYVSLNQSWDFRALNDHSIESRETASGRLKSSFRGHQSPLRELISNKSLALSRDEQYRVCVWSPETAKQFWSHTFDEAGGRPEVYVNDDYGIVSGTDGSVRVFDARGNLLRTFQATALGEVQENPVFYQPEILGSSLSGYVYREDIDSALIPIWNLTDGRLERLFELSGEYHIVRGVRMTANYLLALYSDENGNYPNRVRIWRRSDGKQVLDEAGVLVDLDEQGAVLGSENEIRQLSFDALSKPEQLKLKTISGALIGLTDELFWIWNPDKHEIAGYGRQDGKLMHHWQDEGISWLGRFGSLGFFGASHQSLQVMDLAQNRFKLQVFAFPDALLSRLPDGETISSGNVDAYMHWIKNGQVEPIEPGSQDKNPLKLITSP